MKAVVLYYSHKGKTASYAREIAMYLWSKGVSVSLSSISDFDVEKLRQADVLISGCWTCGWFVVGQHPHKRWVEYSRKMAGLIPPERLLFFTTYKIRTGSLLGRMKKVMEVPFRIRVPFLRSKTGFLTAEDKQLLDAFIRNS